MVKGISLALVHSTRTFAIIIVTGRFITALDCFLGSFIIIASISFGQVTANFRCRNIR